MKTKSINTVGVLLMSLVLAACGSGGNAPLAPTGPGTGIAIAGLGNCSLPITNQAPDRTVTGNLGSGAILTLWIFSQPGNTVAAAGRLVIPSVQSLFQDPSLYFGGNPLATGGVDECVSSNGSVGVINTGNAYDYIELALRGNTTYVELGSRYGIPTYLVSTYIEGSVFLQIPGYSGQVFNAYRP